MTPTRTITLEIDSGRVPLQGTLHAQPNLVRPFTGWIALLAALEEAISNPEAEAD
jgi:hypothetical protein